MSRYFAASVRSRVTWRHSSRVGTTTSACGVPSPGDRIRWSSGMPKPSVLPVPVRAWPMTSSPARASGRVSSWIANVRSMPASPSARTISSRTPSSANVGAVFSTGALAISGREVSSSGTPASLCSSATGSRLVRSSSLAVRVIASLIPARTGPGRASRPHHCQRAGSGVAGRGAGGPARFVRAPSRGGTMPP